MGEKEQRGGSESGDPRMLLWYFLSPPSMKQLPVPSSDRCWSLDEIASEYLAIFVTLYDVAHGVTRVSPGLWPSEA